ncbi:TIGR02221 family CRISPR-associated protein [bacterium]|nr:TIGR02221 family CRISPR-associated protein [bacterium]
MARKVFISFLGTSNYVECNYFLEEDDSKLIKNVKYVQEALLKLHQPFFGREDICYFFLTKDAKSQNWEDGQQFNSITRNYDLPNEGLKNRIISLCENGFQAQIENVEIPEGFSTKDIWAIFQTVFSKLENNDEVYFDITHAFRSIPMLGLALLNYSKAIHNVNVKGIYYGAFEKLGFASEVKKIPLDERNAPILNLTTLSILQDWSNAAKDFIEFGNTQNLTKTLKSNYNYFDTLSKKQNGRLKNSLTKVAQGLQDFSTSIATNRGNSIINNDNARLLNKEIQDLRPRLDEVVQLSPFSSLLSVIENEIKVFEDEDIFNGLIAIKWCIKNKLIQQGITLLQEFIITICLKKIELDYNNKINRDTVSGLLGKRQDDLFNYSNNSNTKLEQEIVVNKLEKEDYYQELIPIFDHISNNIRNDINHAGFARKGKSPEEFEKALVKSFSKFYNLLNFPNIS